MSKNFIFFILILIAILFDFKSYSIQSISPIAEKKSLNINTYFPITVGQKWVYSVTGDSGNTINLTWTVNGMAKINDTDNGLLNIEAFQVVVEETGEIFYFINYEKFLCKYYQSENGLYKMVRILPDVVEKNSSWVSDNTSFVISEYQKDFVKVEFVSNNDDFSGYNLFKNNIGPIEMYIYDTKSTEKNDVLYKLVETKIDRNIQNAITKLPEIEQKTEKIVENPQQTNTLSQTNLQPQQKIEQKENKNQNLFSQNTNTEKRIQGDQQKSQEQNVNQTPRSGNIDLSNRKISTLKENFFYIQVGSFIIEMNAIRVCKDLLDKGYEAYILEDKDGYFKVLIEGNKDQENTLQKIRREIKEDAFMKKRIK